MTEKKQWRITLTKQVAHDFLVEAPTELDAIIAAKKQALNTDWLDGGYDLNPPPVTYIGRDGWLYEFGDHDCQPIEH